MSRWRSTGRRNADTGTAEQVAPDPSSDNRSNSTEVDASWLPPTAASAAATPDLDQAAVTQLGGELGDELIRQAEQHRFDPRPIVQFDHDEIEAILRRASELGATSSVDITELDSATLAEIAAEVGIPASAVAAAVAERRVGIDADTSLLDRLVGPDQIWAGRQSAESSDAANERVIEWLERGHGLRPRTTDDGVVIATRRSGLAGSVVRGVRSAQGKGGLGKVREVRGTAVSLEEGGAVALMADISDRRTGAVAGGGVVAAVGTLTVGTVALVTTPVVLVALPFVAGAGLVTSRLVFRPTVRRVTNELDYTADQIARGVEAPTLLGELTNPITERLRRR